MISWYEQSIDWIIAHTTIEMAFCLFIVAICGMIAWSIWIVAIVRDGRSLNSDIDIFEAIQKAREPHHTRTTPAFTKVTDSE